MSGKKKAFIYWPPAKWNNLTASHVVWTRGVSTGLYYSILDSGFSFLSVGFTCVTLMSKLYAYKI